MTKHSIATTYGMSCVVSLALMLGACDKGESKDAKTATDTKAKAAEKTEAKVPGDAKAKEDGGEEKEPAPADEPLDERVVKAAGLAKKIEADPARADEILAEAGMDRVAFDALIYEVSTPELAEQYRLARARGDG